MPLGRDFEMSRLRIRELIIRKYWRTQLRELGSCLKDEDGNVQMIIVKTISAIAMLMRMFPTSQISRIANYQKNQLRD